MHENDLFSKNNEDITIEIHEDVMQTADSSTKTLYQCSTCNVICDSLPNLQIHYAKHLNISEQAQNQQDNDNVVFQITEEDVKRSFY